MGLAKFCNYSFHTKLNIHLRSIGGIKVTCESAQQNTGTSRFWSKLSTRPYVRTQSGSLDSLDPRVYKLQILLHMQDTMQNLDHETIRNIISVRS